MPSPRFEIVNVVTTVKLSVLRIDIDEIVASFGGSTLERPLSVVIGCRGVSFAFHLRGIVTVTGVRSEREAKTVLKDFPVQLTGSGLMSRELRISRTRVHSLVAAAGLGPTVGLDFLAQSIEGCAYDPCRSAAVPFRTPRSSALCQVHGLGHDTVLGAKSKEEIAVVLERLMAFLDEHSERGQVDN